MNTEELEAYAVSGTLPARITGTQWGTLNFAVGNAAVHTGNVRPSMSGLPLRLILDYDPDEE